MPLKLGKCEAEIEENGLRSINGKSAVSILARTLDGEPADVLIWLTPAAMGMARAQLKVCGFDVDTEELELLTAEPRLLAGKRIPLNVEEYKGRPQPRIDLSAPPPKDEMKRLTQALRSAKSAEKDTSTFSDEAPPPGDDDLVF